MIPTHALGELEYRIPPHLSGGVRAGSAVVVTLSGHSRVGMVVGIEDETGQDLNEVREVVGELSLSEEIVGVCRWVSESTALPFGDVLRRALPPGANLEKFRVVNPLPDWAWRAGQAVGRTALRRRLGGVGLRSAEEEGRIAFSPSLPERRGYEVAKLLEISGDLERAPRQRRLVESLRARGGEARIPELLNEAGARRETLRKLAAREALEIETRHESLPLFVARGGEGPSRPEVERIPGSGAAWLWRVPTREQAWVVEEAVRAALSRWEQALILAPEIDDVEGITAHLTRVLPAGCVVAAYHSGLGGDRAAIYDAARQGAVDVLVGTRTAALVPLPRPGTVVMVNEPDDAHRADPGYEGIPLHTRELAVERARGEGSGALFVSPAPSLSLYSRSSLHELPPIEAPLARTTVVDMSGSGDSLSGPLIEACRQTLQGGGHAGVVLNRLGYAPTLLCGHCGHSFGCPSCGTPLSVFQESLRCARCEVWQSLPEVCDSCGSRRIFPVGFSVERLREELSSRLGVEVGLLTAGRDEGEGDVVVGTAPRILEHRWSLAVLPDFDALLFGGGISASERAFRRLHLLRESSETTLVQTRFPDHHSLAAALRGDYPAFAAGELARRRELGYPPYSHVAALDLEGDRESVLHAVESVLRPALDGVTLLDPVRVGEGRWRALLKAGEHRTLAGGLSTAARLLSGSRGVKLQIYQNLEEI